MRFQHIQLDDLWTCTFKLELFTWDSQIYIYIPTHNQKFFWHLDLGSQPRILSIIILISRCSFGILRFRLTAFVCTNFGPSNGGYNAVHQYIMKNFVVFYSEWTCGDLNLVGVLRGHKTLVKLDWTHAIKELSSLCLKEQDNILILENPIQHVQSSFPGLQSPKRRVEDLFIPCMYHSHAYWDQLMKVMLP